SNVSGSVLNGILVLYTINVTNYGPDNATGLVITDVLDSRLIYINSTSPRFTYYVASTGVWNIGNLANGESIVLDILVRLNGTGSIVNVGNVTGVNENNTGNNSTPDNTTNITVVPTVNISVVKSSNVSGNVLNGAYILYTINVTNYGPDNATGLVITDVLDSRLIYINSTTPRFTFYVVSTGVWSIGNLANGESIVLDILVRLNGTGSIVNIANVTNVTENNTGNNSSTPDNETNITVVTTVNLSIVKTSNVSGNVLNGIFVLYTINVTNFGPDNATGLVITDVLDSRLIYINSTTPRGTSYDATTGVWDINTLANGESIVLDILVRLNGTGSIVNVANVTNVTENNTGNNSSTPDNTTNITVVPTVNISVVKSSNVSGSVLNGILVLYTINVTNYGPDNATGLVITDVLDSRLIYINSTTPRLTSYIASTGVWYIGNLANGESIVLDILVRLNGTGSIVNVANVTGVNENNTGNNSTPDNTTNITVVPTVNISVVKTSNVSGNVLNGAYILYTINVTNFGPDNATGLVITDVLDSRLIYINSTSPRFTSYVASTGVWYIGNLANGESIVLDILVRLNGTGNIVNIANVTNVTENNTGNNSSNPDNETNITVVTTVNLSVVKSSNVSGSVLNGIFVLYTINVTNFGPDNATGLVITDVLDSRLIYINSTTPRGTSYVASTGVWDINTLANGESIVLDILVRLNGTGNIVNIANVTNVTENNTGNNSSTPDNTTNITVVPTVNISVVKSSNVSGSVLNGIFVLYTINVTNFGPDNATGLVITDVLDSRLIYINSTSPRFTYYVASTGVWNIGNLANGESIVLDILVRLNGTGSIVNVANVTGVNENNTGNNSTPDNTTNITVVPTVNISVVKSSNVSGNVLNGAYILYTINVTNFGPDNATGLVITDVLDSRLIYINSTSPRGTSYDAITGVWDINTLANGESIVLDIFVRLNGTGSIVNIANVTNVTENNTGNNSSTPDNTTNITVVPTVNISVVKTSNVSGSVLNGIFVLYTINVTNFGPDNATGLVITDVLDSRLIYINSTSPRFTYYVASTGVWNIGSLANGESIVLDILVRLNGTGSIVNVANVTGVNENNTGNNSTPDNTTNITVVPTVNISVVKSSNVSGNVLNGAYILYTINVTNFGPDNATGLVITDVLDSRLIYINSTSPRFTFYVPGTGIWSIGNLANGESIVLDILVRLNGTGSIVNIANVTNVTENNTGNNSSNPDNETNITVVTTVNLSVVKSSNVSGSVLNGIFVLYTINVTNFGPDNATGLVITDVLDSRLIYINSTSPRGTSYVASTGVWDISTLANGESIVLDILVRLNGTGSIVNIANVTNVTENNTGNNSSTPDNTTNITVVPTVNISVVKSSNVSGS
ncbi:beta strand repeat-containing protein, partial [Methanobrevibacter curvatus]|uniref:beta strand repeat-containing protein n=1 Tax=Methanobrevibacter curvatus TaxID=49547 RepID=UPI000AD24473